MNSSILVVALLLLVHGSLGGRIRLTTPTTSETNGTRLISEAQLFFESIPWRDRDSFIVFHLAKGLIEKSANLSPETRDILQGILNIQSAFKRLDEPEGFSVDLLDWTEDEYDVEEEQVVELVTYNGVCLESGKCVVPRDVGSNCCIF